MPNRCRVLKPFEWYRVTYAVRNSKGKDYARINFIKGGMAVLLSFLFLLGTISTTYGQATKPIEKSWPIPNAPYKSWSLFLISNQDWLLSENQDRLRDLIERYKSFGNATGPTHASVWFYKTPGNIIDVDIERANQFCRRYGLAPSKGPYIIYTTEYPGRGIVTEYPSSFNSIENNLSKIELNCLTSSEIGNFLNELTDNIILSDVSHSETGSTSFWNKMKSAFESMSDSLANFGNKITLTIKAGPVEAKIGIDQ
jgi:hypothetical protein